MTIAFRDGDVAALFKDMGVPVIINGIPGLGLVDENDQIIVSNAGRGEVVGGVHTVRVQASKFPPIKNGMQIIVDGLSYSIQRKVTEEGDAAIKKFVLGDAAGIQEVIIDGGTF